MKNILTLTFILCTSTATFANDTQKQIQTFIQNYQIIGVIEAQNNKNSVAVIDDKQNNKKITLQIGSIIKKDLTLKSISNAKVTLEFKGKSFNLEKVAVVSKKPSFIKDKKTKVSKTPEESEQAESIVSIVDDYEDPPQEVLDSAEIIKEYYDQQIEDHIQKITRFSSEESDDNTAEEIEFIQLEGSLDYDSIEIINIEDIILPPLHQ